MGCPAHHFILSHLNWRQESLREYVCETITRQLALLPTVRLVPDLFLPGISPSACPNLAAYLQISSGLLIACQSPKALHILLS
jgi:hypothetical protein